MREITENTKEIDLACRSTTPTMQMHGMYTIASSKTTAKMKNEPLYFHDIDEFMQIMYAFKVEWENVVSRTGKETKHEFRHQSND